MVALQGRGGGGKQTRVEHAAHVVALAGVPVRTERHGSTLLLPVRCLGA